MMFRLKQWQPIPSKTYEDTEAEECFIGHDGSIRIGPQKSRPKLWRSGLTLVNLGILGASIYFFFSSNVHLHREHNAALKATSYYSPILDDIEIPTYDSMMNGTLFPPEWLSIARQDPGPETDAAWHVYEKVLTHVITKEQVIKLGKDPETVARFDDDYWGFGPDAYMAQMDVMHQIHCLNLLRKAAFEDHPMTITPKEKKDKMYWIHIHHCVDIALQNIKCTATTELLTLSWMDGREIPWPNFSVFHQCRDFDTLVQWQHDNAVDAAKFDRMSKPKDAVNLRAPWMEYPTSDTRFPEGWIGPLHDVGPLFGDEAGSHHESGHKMTIVDMGHHHGGHGG